MEPDPKDPFSRSNYRSLIAWEARMEREGPFLERALADLPERSLVDLGCGTGEHSRWFAGRGFRVVGLDASESMIASAGEEPLPPGLQFIRGDMREADRILTGRFGAALSLGNTIPFLTEEADLRRGLEAVFAILLPGGRFLFQILNYEKLIGGKVRHLPLNFRPGEDGEIVFLRLLDYREGERVLFMPTTLRIRPDAEEPVELVHSRRVELRGWTRAGILPALESAGFHLLGLFGSMQSDPFDPVQSPDLVVLAERPAG
jgi:SAM-dependent methyltransferase